MAGHGRKIIIGIDDSDYSEFAFDYYMENLHKPDDNIVLVHVPEYGTVFHAPALLTDPVVVTELIHEEEKKVKSLVKKYSDKMKQVHLSGKVKQMTGKVGEAIVAAAKEEGATMIVVGTRGMGKVRRTFLGSVSDYCLHHSPVPVLVAKQRASGKGGPSDKSAPPSEDKE